MTWDLRKEGVKSCLQTFDFNTSKYQQSTWTMVWRMSRVYGTFDQVSILSESFTNDVAQDVTDIKRNRCAAGAKSIPSLN